MNLGKYIRELLPEHDTVIIPGLGAFLSTYKPAQIDEKSGEMTPPAKEVTFEPKIRSNDGLLAGKISVDEGMPLTEAYSQLEQERDEILYLLDKGETVFLENIGELSYNQNRELQFIPIGMDNLLLEAYGLESASLKNEPEDIPEEKPTPEDNVEKQETKEPFEEEAPVVYAGASIKDSGNPPGKGNKAWWLLLFLIPLIAGAIYIFTKDTKEPVSTVDVTVKEPSPEKIATPADTLAADTITPAGDEQTAVSEEITDSTGFITPDSTRYYLITGSFEEFKNAQKYFRRLKNEGNEPFHLGKQGSFYLVGTDIFDNEIEAYGQQYNYLDKHPESGAWIFIPGKIYIPYEEKKDTIN